MQLDDSVARWGVVRDAVGGDALVRLRDAVDADAFRLASIAYPSGAKVDAAVRSNDRAQIVAPRLAAELFALVGPSLPPVVHGRRLVALAPRLRFYRYRVGQRFAPHRDGIENGDGASSLVTVLVAVQRAVRGGATHFLATKERVLLEPGDVLWFQHSLLHEGCAVEEGEKLLVRTDAMYAMLDPR